MSKVLVLKIHFVSDTQINNNMRMGRANMIKPTLVFCGGHIDIASITMAKLWDMKNYILQHIEDNYKQSTLVNVSNKL
jgi:hypothetical protein